MRHGEVKKFAWVIIPGNGRGGIQTSHPSSSSHPLLYCAGWPERVGHLCRVMSWEGVMDRVEGVWKYRVLMGGICPIVT